MYYNLPMNDVDIYVSASGYTQRKFTTIISPTSILNITGYLLQSSQGNLIRFHIKNQAGSSVENVIVKAYKYIDFTWQVVEETLSDDAGVGTLFLNPLTTYTIEFSKSGYTSMNTTIQPSTEDYTITLSSTSGYTPAEEQLTNITYSILPQDNVTATNTTFEFKINSFDNKLEWFSFNVTHNNTQLFFGNETTASGGNITTIQDLSSLNWNASIVTYAIFKKTGINDTFTITNSYYIWSTETPSPTSVVSISDWIKENVNMEHSNPYPKIFFSLGYIMISMIAGAYASSQGAGMLGLIVIGIGLTTGLLTFAATGTGIVIGIVFGLMVMAYLSIMFLRGGI